MKDKRLSLIEIWIFRNCDLVRAYHDAPIEAIEQRINSVLKKKELYRKMKNNLPDPAERRDAENVYLDLDGQYNVLGFILTSRGFVCEYLRHALGGTRPKAVAAACSLDLKAVLELKQEPPVVDE